MKPRDMTERQADQWVRCEFMKHRTKEAKRRRIADEELMQSRRGRFPVSDKAHEELLRRLRESL